MAKVKTFEDLFHHELKDLYSAEKQMLRSLPKMAKSATSEELRQAFEDHLQETEEQVRRLEQVFEELGLPTRVPKCKAMEGLVEEAKEIMEEVTEPDVLDAALIAAAQRAEHYEIAGYGCARTFAQQLGHNNIADILQTTLDEEGNADKRLTDLAESRVNQEAQS